MKGNVEHNTHVRQPDDPDSPLFESGKLDYLTIDVPTLVLSNDDDDHYWQGFESRDEVETFIAGLRAAADALWTQPK